MKVVILAGGLPSTLMELDERIPKPMAEVGGKPLIWHIMKYYSSFGLNDFIICGGYKIDIIKEYFMNFYYHQSDITVDLETNEIILHRKQTEPWKVNVVDTGINTGVSERIRCIQPYVMGDESFFVTYGDCLSDIDLTSMIKLHYKEGKYATLAVARPSGRNVVLPITSKGFKKGAKVEEMLEDAWVNACSMIFSQKVFLYLEEHSSLEHTIFHLGNDEQLSTYCHDGFWTPVETNRDRNIVERMWNEKSAPWKKWE